MTEGFYLDTKNENTKCRKNIITWYKTEQSGGMENKVSLLCSGVFRDFFKKKGDCG